MKTKDRNLLIAVVVVVVLLLAYWAWYRRRSGKGYPAMSNFCGGLPEPGSMSEAAGLHELGVRMSEGFCGTTPAPAALAEAQGLMQMGWRPEHMRARPSCGGPSPAAVSEAQALQHANALWPGAPYYTKSGFTGSGGCGGAAPAALGEARLLRSLQALPSVDGFAAHKLSRDKAAFASTQSRHAELRSNPAQVPARQARLNSMREGFEGFGGPAQAGYGWAPTAADAAATPMTGGWGDAQSTGAAVCTRDCMDGCVGTHCADHCKDRCRSGALLAATGDY
jgi:hypothetical protein